MQRHTEQSYCVHCTKLVDFYTWNAEHKSGDCRLLRNAKIWLETGITWKPFCSVAKSVRQESVKLPTARSSRAAAANVQVP